jgi:hypothetical protein
MATRPAIVEPNADEFAARVQTPEEIELTARKKRNTYIGFGVAGAAVLLAAFGRGMPRKAAAVVVFGAVGLATGALLSGDAMDSSGSGGLGTYFGGSVGAGTGYWLSRNWK